MVVKELNILFIYLPLTSQPQVPDLLVWFCLGHV